MRLILPVHFSCVAIPGRIPELEGTLGIPAATPALRYLGLQSLNDSGKTGGFTSKLTNVVIWGLQELTNDPDHGS